MTDRTLAITENIDVIVIGAGPAGLSAATTLKQLGVSRVVVLEREAVGGGVPRHCGHPPFGMREFKRIYTGPQYACGLTQAAIAIGVELFTGVTVVEMRPNGQLLISDTENGLREVSARRILLATGGRETPRSARFLPGGRPQGVINTGALQSLVYLSGKQPFKRPVIVGSELVSFSAIQTCRHAGIKPVGMIESRSEVTAFAASAYFAKLMRVPIFMDSKLVGIDGGKQVESVTIESSTGVRKTLSCDGVIVSGCFTPEASLARSSHLVLDVATGGPQVNQFGQCSDNTYYAAGNVLRAIETAGWSWNEGRRIAACLARDLQNDHHASGRKSSELDIQIMSPLIKYCVPQRISLGVSEAALQKLQLRFTTRSKGDLIVRCNNRELWRKTVRVKPEKRVLVDLSESLYQGQQHAIELHYEQVTERE